MSAHRAVNAIRRIARHEVEQRVAMALGVVQSVHGTNGGPAYACTVELRDTGIVLPKVPIATGLIGTVALPREKDLVVVGFAGGDLHAPVVLGRLYSEQVAPPENKPGEFVLSLPGDETQPDKALALRIETPGDGTRSLKITLDGSVKVEVEVNDQGVSIQTPDASLKLSQTSASDGVAEMKVGDSKVTIEQSGNVTIEASGTLTLKGSKVEVSGDASVKIAGTTVDLN
jgi:uncharacterized protein involved in type VI secretion and phage assembly